MDPNEALRMIRMYVADALDTFDGNNQDDELAQVISDLDDWLSTGGFLPTAWQR